MKQKNLIISLTFRIILTLVNNDLLLDGGGYCHVNSLLPSMIPWLNTYIYQCWLDIHLLDKVSTNAQLFWAGSDKMLFVRSFNLSQSFLTFNVVTLLYVTGSNGKCWSSWYSPVHLASPQGAPGPVRWCGGLGSHSWYAGLVWHRLYSSTCLLPTLSLCRCLQLDCNVEIQETIPLKN